MHRRSCKLGGKRTTRLDLTGLSMNSRPWNIRPAGSNERQKFTDFMDLKMEAPHIMPCSQTLWTNLWGEHQNANTTNKSPIPYVSVCPTIYGVLLYAAAHNKLDDWSNFNCQEFGKFDDITLPKHFAKNLDNLAKQSV